MPLDEQALGLGPEFIAFYEANFSQAIGLAFLLVGSRDAAEDIAQEAFLSMSKHFDRVSYPNAYLRSTIVRKAASMHRTETRRLRRFERAFVVDHVDPEVVEVVDVMARLPYRQRACLTLRYWGGLSINEIASALHCRPGTVKAAISRGLARLRKELEE